MTTTTAAKPVIYSPELEQKLDAELKRIGAFDEGDGGLIAFNRHGYLAVGDEYQRDYVSERSLSALKALPANLITQDLIDDERDQAWDKVYEAIGAPDFSEIDAQLDEIYQSIGETGYFEQENDNSEVIFYRESNSDKRVISNIPGAYARHYLEATYV